MTQIPQRVSQNLELVLRPPARASPVCFPEHVPLPLGMDVLDDGSHGLPWFLEDREVTVRPGNTDTLQEGSFEDLSPLPNASKGGTCAFLWKDKRRTPRLPVSTRLARGEAECSWYTVSWSQEGWSLGLSSHVLGEAAFAHELKDIICIVCDGKGRKEGKRKGGRDKRPRGHC